VAINTSIQTVVAPAARRYGSAGTSHRSNVALWAVQIGLAGLFAFAGAGKLFGSAEAIKETSEFPVLFLRFIGACEVLGAIGLIAPWALRIRPGLTPLAAAGLAIIMVGATVTVAVTMSPALALIDLAVCAAAVYVVRGRSNYATRTR
jgi:hypothetical protein